MKLLQESFQTSPSARNKTAVSSPHSSHPFQVINQLFRIARIILGVMIFLFLLPIEAPYSVQVLPLMLSLVVLGLPHGAIDHLVPGLIRQSKLPHLAMILFIAAYIFLAMLVLALWWMSPVWGFVFFILITWWHWGSGDLAGLLELRKVKFINGPFLPLFTIIIRGGIPMLVPLVFFPDQYKMVASSIAEIFNKTSIDRLLPIFDPDFRMSLFIFLVTCVGVFLILTFEQARSHNQLESFKRFALETILLILFFAVVPAYVAIGIYFCFWHSGQHIVRLILLDPTASQSFQSGDIPSALGRFMRLSAPLTAVSILSLIALFYIVPQPPAGLIALSGLYLALIAALTLPHSVLVFWMDWRKGIL